MKMSSTPTLLCPSPHLRQVHRPGGHVLARSSLASLDFARVRWCAGGGGYSFARRCGNSYTNAPADLGKTGGSTQLAVSRAKVV